MEQNKRKFLIYASRLANSVKSGNVKLDKDSLQKLLTELSSNDPMNEIYKRNPTVSMQKYEQPYAVVYREILLAYSTAPSQSSLTRSISISHPFNRSSSVLALINPLAVEFYAICKHHGMQSSVDLAKKVIQTLWNSSMAAMYSKTIASIDASFAEELEKKMLSVEEKKMIWEVMSKDVGSGVGSFGGHWYECPNGHIYTIGECGGAMEESICPECGEKIGGKQHKVTAGNRVSVNFLQEIQKPDLIPVSEQSRLSRYLRL